MDGTGLTSHCQVLEINTQPAVLLPLKQFLDAILKIPHAATWGLPFDPLVRKKIIHMEIAQNQPGKNSQEIQ